MNAEIRIGTCGYSFPDWKGIIYPPNLRPSLYLVHYARTLGFNAVELDSSFYHMPTIPLIEALMRKTEPGFLFTVKAHRSMTHEIWNAMKPAAPERPAFPDLASGLKNATLLAPATLPISGCTDAIQTGSARAERNGMTTSTRRRNWSRYFRPSAPWLQARR